jgi:periplasmic protein TonB
MGNSFSVRFSKIFQTTSEESWIARVKQNARTFFELRRAALAQDGVGAFDLIEERPAPGTRQRQAGSLIVHAVAIGIVLWLGGHAKNPEKLGVLLPKLDPTTYSPPRNVPRIEKPGSGNGAGGQRDALPPTTGELARRSWMVLVHPHMPDQQAHTLVIEPTVFGTEEMRRVNELGLPWMKDKNNSNGPGPGKGIGTTPGNTMGTNNGDDEGFSDTNGPYRAAAYPVKCLYCPDPEYTDEARHEKLQGSVTMRVLVTADGRAGQIRIVRGLGLGLDERAVEKVRTWRFQPARDANKNAVAEWVTVEATYRLF